MRPTSESAEWIFLATNLGLEMLSAACDQASSPRRPHFARFGMLLAIAAVLISIGELIYRGKRESVVLRRWGMLWWFYHPSPRHTPFGTLPDIYGLVAGISQCICSIVQYVYCLRHVDSPYKASLLPAIFLICLVGSRLSNNRMNANTSSTEETSLHPILDNQEVEVEGNKEQQERERLLWEREREQEQQLQVLRLLPEQERQLLLPERERERLLLLPERERERLLLLPERLLLLREWEQERERERERLLLREWERERLLLQEWEREWEQKREQVLRVRLLRERERLPLLQEQLETKLK